MEIQKIINSLDNEFIKGLFVIERNWVGINDQWYETYNPTIQIKIKTENSRSILCDYSDGCILKRTISAVGQEANVARKGADRSKKHVIFKIGDPFIDYISDISNTQVDSSNCLDFVM